MPGPSNEMLVDAPGEEVQLGAIEGSVVAEPATHLRIDFRRDAGQVRRAAAPKMPCPDRLAERSSSRGRDGWREANEVASRSARLTSPEGIAEKCVWG